jgi:hypothetical protein
MPVVLVTRRQRRWYVALPMDEQRILEQMERMLAADDPRLAARLAAFGQPGLGQSLRTRRARAALSVMVLILIAAVAAVIYMMSSLRPGAANSPWGRQSSSAAPQTPGSQQPKKPASAAPAAHPGSSAGPANVTHCAATVSPARCGTWSVASGLMPRRAGR